MKASQDRSTGGTALSRTRLTVASESTGVHFSHGLRITVGTTATTTVTVPTYSRVVANLFVLSTLAMATPYASTVTTLTGLKDSLAHSFRRDTEAVS